MTQKYLFGCIIILFIGSGLFAQTPIPNAHAHNDYEHDRPLLDALDNGFVSVEADLHLIKGKLYVSHDKPKDLKSTPTLESIYLKPLREIIEKNNGKVYPGYEKYFYLMVDFKTEANSTYEALRKVLKKYSDILSVIENGKDQVNKPVKVFISGNRPIELLMNDPVKYAGLDGRPDDLDKDYFAAIMPVVSDNYRNFMNWDGNGEVKDKELEKVKSFIEQAHQQNKKVRLWAAPDTQKGWDLLISLGVDMINTDRLSDYNAYMKAKK
ncbi:MAG: phosphatidylinositol-specific phospholipase C/glycerophosphodiester phosphodiesterase family protein [Bacteroidota bacterium]